MKKSLCLFLLTIILAGCGGGDNTVVNDSNDNEPIRFKIGQNTWQLSLPNGWEPFKLNIPGTIFVGQNQDQNLIIAQKPGYDDQTIGRIKDNATETFFDFELVKENSTSLIFDGKLSIQEPLRRFHEKILPVLGTDSYLVGVCSYDYWEGRQEACSTILNQWVAEEVTNN